MSGSYGIHRTHDCGSPGCTRVDRVIKRHCASPGCTGGTSYLPTQQAPTKKEELVRRFDPSEYKVLAAFEKNGYVALKIRYPDAVNFGGIKILVYKCTLAEIINQIEKDPHFDSRPFSEYLSPVARFRPSDEGWQIALLFMDKIDSRLWSK